MHIVEYVGMFRWMRFVMAMTSPDGTPTPSREEVSDRRLAGVDVNAFYVSAPDVDVAVAHAGEASAAGAVVGEQLNAAGEATGPPQDQATTIAGSP
jgi:hypothetical protein